MKNVGVLSAVCVAVVSVFLLFTPELKAQKKYDWSGFTTGMTYDEVQKRASAIGAKIIENGASKLVLQLPEQISSGRPIWLTATFNANDQTKEITIQELNVGNDNLLIEAAVKRWGKSNPVPMYALNPTIYWGNQSAYHAEHTSERYNANAGCVCLRIVDPALANIRVRSIASAPSGSTSIDLRVADFRLGDNIDTAAQNLAAKGFRIGWAKFPWQGEKAFIAKSASEEYIFQAVNDQTFHIVHQQQFGIGQQPELQLSLDALRKKYGRTSSEDTRDLNPGAFNYDWVYLQNGTPTTQSCGNGQGLSDSRETIYTPLGNEQLNFPVDPRCQFGAHAHGSVDVRTQTITRLTIDLYNTKNFAEFSRRRQNNELQQQKRNATSGSAAPL